MVTVLQFCHMSTTITVRLDKELDAWLRAMSAATGLPRGRIIRDQLERARAAQSAQSFMSLAGTVRGPKDLSQRKGFSRR